MPVMCYLVQTYHLPEQVYRLVARLRRSDPDAVVLVSHDRDRPPLDERVLEASGAVLLLGPGGRGDFATVQRYLDAARWLVDHGVAYDWLINITGQDYPLEGAEEVARRLTGPGFDGYLEHFRVFSSESPWGAREGRSRYLFRYRWLRPALSARARRVLRPLVLLNFLQPLVRINVSYGLTLGLRARSPFTRWPCHGGSFYGNLSRPCVDHVLEFCRRHPDVVERLRHTLVPEEVFLQTVLVNAGTFSLADDSLRYYDFSSTSDGSPAVLRAGDVPAMVGSGALFARKFDVRVDDEVLDVLDQRARV